MFNQLNRCKLPAAALLFLIIGQILLGIDLVVMNIADLCDYNAAITQAASMPQAADMDIIDLAPGTQEDFLPLVPLCDPFGMYTVTAVLEGAFAPSLNTLPMTHTHLLHMTVLRC